MGTEIFSNINWLGVLLGAVAYFILGAIWYSFLFRNAWIKATGINPNDPNMKSGVGGIFLTSFILMVIASLGIALFMSKIEIGNWMTGAKVGLVAGICFSFTALSISYLYEKKPLALHLINGVYNTLGCVAAGVMNAVM